MRVITSRSNPEIQYLHALKDNKIRAQQQCFIAEGLRTCETLLKYGVELISFYVTEPLLEVTQALVTSHNHTCISPANHYSQSRPKNDKSIHDNLILVSQSVMEKISTATTPSGLLGLFRMPPQTSPEQLTPGLVLVNITDPGNMGTLIRSAAAMNVKSLVIVDGTDPWSPKVVQASAGTIGAITLFKWSWQELIHYKKNKQLYALIVTSGQSPTSIRPNNALLVVGSEAHGLTDSQIQECDHLITIPMPGGTESLNAAVAGSIALYITFVGRYH